MAVDVKKVVLEEAEDILGLEQADMLENMDMNLREEGLIDSISTVSLFANIESRLHKKIDMKKLKAEDIVSFNSIIAAVEREIK